MGKYVIVGGSSGIGLEIVKELHTQGHQLYVISRQNRNLDEMTDTTHIQYDVTADIALDVSAFPEQIDGLAYCPGSITLKSFMQLKPDDYIRDYRINVIGAVNVIKALLPRLKKSPEASIVLFGSVAAEIGMPFHASIASAKGAVISLGKSLAAELAPAIRVNTISPSLTDTPLANNLLNNEVKMEAARKRHPLGKFGQPQDIAALAVFLLNDKSAWITGQTINIDGGMSSLRI